MPDPEHEDYQLAILDVVYDTVVTDADAELSRAFLKLNAARRTRVNGEAIDGLKQSTSRRLVELPYSLRCRRDVANCVGHLTGLEAKLAHELLVGDSPLFVTSLGGTTDISLVLQCLERTIKELGGHDHGTATSSARSDLDGLSLRCGDVIALPATEPGQGHGSHGPTVQLVQVAHK